MKLVGVVVACILAVVATRVLLPIFDEPEASSLPADFDTLSRQEQVMVCAGCHREQYEDEMEGPHANAYVRLVEHLGKKPTGPHHPEFYSMFLNAAGEKYCVSCHASENLFDGSLNLSLAEVRDKFKESTTGQRPMARVGEDSRHTGVDCLTCHYDANGVVAGEHFKPGSGNGSGKSCLPRPSDVLSSDFGCAPCHAVNKASEESFYFTGSGDELRCISCHVEHRPSGKRTHYYYWRHDSRSRPSNSMLSGFYRPKGMDLADGTLKIYVNTSLLPHRLSECPESLIRYEVCDPEGRVVASSEMRLNMRKEHIRQTEKIFQGNILVGSDGYAPQGLQDTVVIIPLPPTKSRSPYSLRVIGISKPHYWIPDSEGAVVYRDSFPL